MQRTLLTPAHLKDRRTVSLRDLHDWRALTTNTIARLETSSNIGKGMEAHLTRCISRIMSFVQEWVPFEILKTLEKDLQAIFIEAVSLSQTLRCQRACWTVRHTELPSVKNIPAFFDEMTMEDIHGDDDTDTEDMHMTYRKIVDVIASPALYKQGVSFLVSFKPPTSLRFKLLNPHFSF